MWCRFLEATNCVGMCTNLCKLPSQKFINKSLGMPTNMIPNFEDKSCEIIFGQLPPADDPALKQPCYHNSCNCNNSDIITEFKNIIQLKFVRFESIPMVSDLVFYILSQILYRHSKANTWSGLFQLRSSS
ncbi:hypothetical protein M5K25_025493 [Dendrobium thyrsiflorum]|uniref:Beta-carotene isomerase D27-like C-terminal domain-containing protein n=1 Tax=Dendrobium thyrsiflorum TaxID=117978 RepID=A0ABD0U9T5_DENTH